MRHLDAVETKEFVDHPFVGHPFDGQGWPSKPLAIEGVNYYNNTF